VRNYVLAYVIVIGCGSVVACAYESVNDPPHPPPRPLRAKQWPQPTSHCQTCDRYWVRHRDLESCPWCRLAKLSKQVKEAPRHLLICATSTKTKGGDTAVAFGAWEQDKPPRFIGGFQNEVQKGVETSVYFTTRDDDLRVWLDEDGNPPFWRWRQVQVEIANNAESR